jgi:hypothetical protein
MQNSWDYQRLSEACGKAGCVLCRLSGETTQRYLETWKDEMFTDVSIREALRSSKGFCHTHTWQLVQMGATLPLAQAYRDIITDEIEQLENNEGTRMQRRFHFKSGNTLSTLPPCPACQQRDHALARYISSLRQALSDTSFYTLFLASNGLCLHHFHLTCILKPLSSPESWLPPLRKAQLTILQRLDQQLIELIRKHDYRYQHEIRGAEMTSWQTASALVAGEKTQ